MKIIGDEYDDDDDDDDEDGDDDIDDDACWWIIFSAVDIGSLAATRGQQNPSCRGWKQMNYGRTGNQAAKI